MDRASGLFAVLTTFSLMLTALCAQAGLAELDDTALSKSRAQAGVTFTLDSTELRPLGAHPVLDPEDPPNFKIVYSANKFVIYGDSTADSTTQLDFWASIDRITTNPNACLVSDGDEAACIAGGGDPRLKMTFSFDIASRQVERWISENSGTPAVLTKQHYMIFSFDNAVINFGPGDNFNPYLGDSRYWDHDTNSLCATQHVGTASCAFRGLSLHSLDTNSSVSCDDCEGNFLDEINFYGQGTVSGRMLMYGRDSGLAVGS